MLNTLTNLTLFIRKKHKYVFFSENKNYQKYLIDFIAALASTHLEIIYLSSEKNDKIILPNVKNIYIGSGLKRLFYLNLIKSDFFFMTLTDLGNHEIKKNKNIDKYIYIFHAANSVHRAYTPTAFDNYDIILCPGPKYEIEIKKLEKLNNLSKKEIIKTGYFYLDKLQKFKNKKNTNLKTVLIAPSWNYNDANFLVNYSEEVIKKLINLNYKVIFRPHPEHFVRNKVFLEILLKKYIKFQNFTIDKNENNLDSMLESKYLITDYSGIAIEYLLGLNKPVIYFDKYPKIHNENYKDIQEDTIEDDVKKLFGISVNDPDIENLEDYLIMSEKKIDNNLQLIENYTKENFFNLNNSINYTFNLFKDR
jgi:CDP-glycerol glycerophosphotransferase (TagB/SpsB family)